MASPKSRISRSKRGMRRAHNFATPKTLTNCPSCDSVVQPHHVCPFCGFYKGKEIVVAPPDEDSAQE